MQVEITVGQQLDSHWSGWLSDLSVSRIRDGETTLSGEVTDQAALYGLLTRLRDLGLPLIFLSTCPDREPVPE